MAEPQEFQLGDVLGKLWAKLAGWVEGLVVMLPNLLIALLVVAMGAFASRWAQRGVHRVLSHATHNEPIARLLGTVCRIIVLSLALLWALSLLQLDKTVTSMLAGVGVVGLALGFAFQDIFENPIINDTRTENRRMDLSVGTACGDDMASVRQVVLTAVGDVPHRDRDVELYFEEFGDSSINCQVRIWLAESSSAPTWKPAPKP
jgi:small-conductance mechanosensitive channel